MDLLTRISEARSLVLVQMRDLEARFRRTTPRERLLVGGLVFAAVIYAVVQVIGWRDAAREDYINALTDRSSATLARAAAIRSSVDGPEDAAIEDMNSWGFTASNVAVAQVELEQRLVQAATRAGLTNVKITTDSTLEAIGPTLWLGAEVRADLRWSTTFDFIDELTGWPEGFRVTQFKYDVSTLPIFNVPNADTVPASGSVVVSIAVPVIVPADQVAGQERVG